MKELFIMRQYTNAQRFHNCSLKKIETYRKEVKITEHLFTLLHQTTKDY